MRPWHSPAVQMPASGSPSSKTRLPRWPETRSLTSSKPPPRASISRTCWLIAFFATRAVLWNVRKMSSVERSSAWTMRSLMFWWMGDSTVHMKRVPMFTPSAPSARAATSPRASAMPPDAMIGISSASAVAGMSTRPGTSSSPGWPAQSRPSMETASTPRVCAFSAWRTDVALWMTLMPCGLKSARCSEGFEPAVSTILMPDSMIAWRYSA